MSQQNKTQSSVLRTIPEFYDLLAPDYDVMTGFAKRFVVEKPFFRLVVDRYGIRNALDAGCGSGFHSILLSQLGVQTTAVDASSEMVRLTREHARSYGVPLKTVKGTFEELGRKIEDRFDGVFVMGNALAHLIGASDLERSIASLADLLQARGMLFMQILNFDRILTSREPIQSTKVAGSKTFVRYYDYTSEQLLFNILTLEKRDGTIEEKLQTIRLRPILRNDLEVILSSLGFKEVKFFGGISMEPFDPVTSKDLVVLARQRSTSAIS